MFYLRYSCSLSIGEVGTRGSAVQGPVLQNEFKISLDYMLSKREGVRGREREGGREKKESRNICCEGN